MASASPHEMLVYSAAVNTIGQNAFDESVAAAMRDDGSVEDEKPPMSIPLLFLW